MFCSLFLNSWINRSFCFSLKSSRNNKTVSLPGFGGLLKKQFLKNAIMKSQRNETGKEDPYTLCEQIASVTEWLCRTGL